MKCSLGITTTIFLVLIFATLKLFKVITLGWWFVLLPVWGPLLAGALAILVIGAWNRIRKRI